MKTGVKRMGCVIVEVKNGEVKETLPIEQIIKETERGAENGNVLRMG